MEVAAAGLVLKGLADQVQQLIVQAQNSANSVLLTAATQAHAVIEDLNRQVNETADRQLTHLDGTVAAAVGQAQTLANSLSAQTAATLHDTMTQWQTIANTLP